MNEPEEILELHNLLKASQANIFPHIGRVRVSEKQGVYIISDQNKRVLHVGTTKRGVGGLNQRLNDHLSGTSSFKKNYLKPRNISLHDGYFFQCIEVEDARKRVLLEALTAGLLCPVYIGTGSL